MAARRVGSSIGSDQQARRTQRGIHMEDASQAPSRDNEACGAGHLVAKAG